MDRVKVIGELEDVARGEVAGYVTRPVGIYDVITPRMSKKHYAEYLESQLPEAPGELPGLLARFPHLSEKATKMFLRSKRVVVDEGHGDGDRLSIVPNMPEIAEPEDLFEDHEEVVEITAEDLANRLRKRVYGLAQVFFDSDVQAKYDISAHQLGTASRMAIGQPAAAARFLQDAMNAVQTDVNVRVVSGEYAKDKSQARLVVKAVAKGVPETSVTITALTIGRDLLLYGPEGYDDWHVKGPLNYAEQVQDLYKLVLVYGPADVGLLLGMEMVLLSLDICWEDSYAEVSVEYHVGTNDEVPVGVSEDVAKMLSTDQALTLSAMAARMEVVSDGLGVQVATAVRVTDRHLLINSHVLDSVEGVAVAGSPVRTHKQLARDLWSCISVGDATAWPVRDAVVGELVFVAYLREGEVSTSSPLQVVSVLDSCITVTKSSDVVPGTSGGALVAISDLSLLGIHSAETNRNLISYAFGSRQFAELMDGDEVTTVSRKSDPGSFGASAFERFKKRGLAHVVTAAMGSLVPVFTDFNHVGMAARVGTRLYTACNPELALRVGTDRKALVFESTGVGSLCHTTNPFVTLTTPVYRRKPEYYEKVFVIGYDVEDAYFSTETTVLHIGLDAKTFVIGSMSGMDKPLSGGLVLAWDGAVVGICGFASATTAVGLGYVCWGLPEPALVKTNDPKIILMKAFPFLNVQAWEPGLLEEVFTHSSVGKYSDGRTFNAGCKPLANIGDNAIKAMLYVILREKGFPHPQWSQVMQAAQSNVKLAAVAWDVGFAQCMQAGPGVDMPKTSKAYADLTEALAGAVYLVETPDVFRMFCEACQLVLVSS